MCHHVTSPVMSLHPVRLRCIVLYCMWTRESKRIDNEKDSRQSSGSEPHFGLLLVLYLFLTLLKVRDKADQRAVNDCSGGCWGSDMSVRVNRVGWGVMGLGGGIWCATEEKIDATDTVIHLVDLEKTHLRSAHWMTHLDYLFISSNVCHHLSHSK